VNGHEDVVVRLLEKGAKPNVVNAGGRTALDEAMHNDRRACVDAIMKASGAHEAQEVDDIEVPGENMENMGPESDEDR
jgi:ankyrin repeat protein